MKLSYQQPDPATTLRAIENEPESEVRRHTSDTPRRRAAVRQPLRRFANFLE